MLPLADTEKLIREKDEEVSMHLASPRQRPQVPRWPRQVTACNLALHSCAACKRC